MQADPFNLARFVTAQESAYDTALRELKSGRKKTHWIWFIFPQMKGLGHSDMAQFFGVSSLEEAEAYLNHPILGQRLVECTQAALHIQGRSLHDIFGSPDDMKFRSSMTLFAAAAAQDNIFAEALHQLCDGQLDAKTLALLKGD